MFFFFSLNIQIVRARKISDVVLRGPRHRGYSHPLHTLRRSPFPRPSGCSERVEPDDIAREICRHCAATELRGGNTALPLTSPCYNAIRSSLFVPVASPYRRPSAPSRVIPPNHRRGFILTDRPASFALPRRRNYNSSKCPTLHGFRRNPVITSILNEERKARGRKRRETGGRERERASELLEIDDFVPLRRRRRTNYFFFSWLVAHRTGSLLVFFIP